MKTEAPPHSGNYVLGSTEQETVTKVKKRCWYLFWGLLPIGGNSSADLINEMPPGYRIVKIQTSLDSGSFFVSLFTAGIVGSSVIVVEGVAPTMHPGEMENKPIESSLPP